MSRSGLITPSSCRTALECLQKYHIAYDLGVRPLQSPEEFRFGTMWHDCQEAGLLAVRTLEQGDSRAYQTFLYAAVDAVPRDAEPFEAAKVRAHLHGQVLALRADRFFDKHEILAVEEPFVFPHMNPATGKKSPLWRRAGKMDAIVRHVETGRVRVMEHKTTSEDIAVDSTYWLRLVLDNQISQYVIAAEIMHPELVVDEVVYDVLAKAGTRPSAATPIESRKYTQPKYKACPECKKKDGISTAPHHIDLGGGAFATCEPDPEDVTKRRIMVDFGRKLYANMREADETPAEYEERLVAAIEADPSSYYRIQVVPRTEAQIVEHLENVWSLSQIIRTARNDGYWPKNPDACHKYGSTCPYFAHCTHTGSLEDTTKFQRLDDVHPELGGFIAKHDAWMESVVVDPPEDEVDFAEPLKIGG